MNERAEKSGARLEHPSWRVIYVCGKISPNHDVLESTDPCMSVHVDSISKAATVAQPGDTVLISPGIYRERIVPTRAGTPDAPIRYVASGREVVVRGSVEWKPAFRPVSPRSRVLIAEIDPSLFPGPNLFATTLFEIPGLCCGQLFCDGAPMTELTESASVMASPGSWVAIDCGERLIFHPPRFVKDPESHLLELTVADRLFASSKRGLGYIHLEGICFEHCGNQFPNGFWKASNLKGHPQSGAVGTRGGHHWVIRGCTIRHAKTIGLDCGDEGGWDIENGAVIDVDPTYKNVGYHLIENNDISDNGACGIAGAGGRETRIIGNRIERNNAQGFRAPETAGIKLHFIFDALIEGNLVRDNDAAGIWLDNEWYGTRVTRNVCLNNLGQGIFIELGSGPCLVDHNVCAMTRLGDGIYCHDASGVRIVHNLVMGNAHLGLYLRVVTDRLCYAKDRTQVIAGASNITALNNVFIDNYRGAISMPEPFEPRVIKNRCDHNLFVDATQWQWEGQPAHRFILNHKNGSQSGEMDRPAVAIGQSEWQETGHDAHSHFHTITGHELENGAPAKGWIFLSPCGLTLWLADPARWIEMMVPMVAESNVDESDGPVIAGPFRSGVLGTPGDAVTVGLLGTTGS